MKKAMLIVMCLLSSMSWSQWVPKKHIVRLYNNEIKEGTRLVYEYPIMQPSFFFIGWKAHRFGACGLFQKQPWILCEPGSLLR